MRGLGVGIAALWVSATSGVAPQMAQAAPAARHVSACCVATAGTAVKVELVDQVSTKIQKSGDTFAFRLAAPLVVNGRMLLRAGTPGMGEVVQSTRPGLGGKSAKLVLAARYLTTRRGRLPLRGLQLAASGRNNATEARMVGLTGMAFAPMGFVALAIRGGDVVFPPGVVANARLASNVSLPSLGPPPRNIATAVTAPSDDLRSAAQGAIEIPPPPAGQGQVVFFRKYSLLSTAQWFKVREDGKALGKLSNGVYFIQATPPGVHVYTATFEPELKDHLKLEVGVGETYFVEGVVSRALVVGAADLSPSDRVTFEKASKHLKLAAAPTEETADTSDKAENKAVAEPGDTPRPAPAPN